MDRSVRPFIGPGSNEDPLLHTGLDGAFIAEIVDAIDTYPCVNIGAGGEGRAEEESGGGKEHPDGSHAVHGHLLRDGFSLSMPKS
jgi:hypothetical protein